MQQLVCCLQYFKLHSHFSWHFCFVQLSQKTSVFDLFPFWCLSQTKTSSVSIVDDGTFSQVHGRHKGRQPTYSWFLKYQNPAETKKKTYGQIAMITQLSQLIQKTVMFFIPPMQRCSPEAMTQLTLVTQLFLSPWMVMSGRSRKTHSPFWDRGQISPHNTLDLHFFHSERNGNNFYRVQRIRSKVREMWHSHCVVTASWEWGEMTSCWEKSFFQSPH